MSKKSNFIKDAGSRIKNRKWLRYSSNISRRILAALDDSKEIDRNILASKLDVSKQYISKLTKGQENLSLETIAKLSEALGVELISFPEYKYSSVEKETIPTITNDNFPTLSIVAFENIKSAGNVIKCGIQPLEIDIASTTWFQLPMMRY